jgi:hypothetical protein
VSYRRNGYGAAIISWSTIRNEPMYQSFQTMRACLKYPTKLVNHCGLGRGTEITIEIDIDKLTKLPTLGQELWKLIQTP